jgi:biotin carboxyl carrier protein
MSKYRIKMNGKTYEMEIELVDEKTETKSIRGLDIPNVAYKNNTDSVVRVISPEAERQTISNDNKVFSPMPGAIIRIMAQAGDFVVAGDPILVLEAMKMENEICAQKSGKIKEIFVTEGQTVPGNVPLFEMEG